jgi:transposase
MVAAIRTGESVRAVARRFQVSRPTVQRWVQRAVRQRLDRVDWADRPPVPHTVSRTPPAVEERVLHLRRTLKDESPLGEYGAAAIQREWRRQWGAVPALRTIGRILNRRGALEGQRRVRTPPPPPGWYLPAVAQGTAELDSFDTIEDLVIEGGIPVEVLTGVSLHGGLVAAWPEPAVTTDVVLAALMAHWRGWGLPAYAQFDNDTRFQGAHQFSDAIGRVTRLCLSLGIVPVFAPVQEHGFQAAIEAFNGRWQAKVWHRFHHEARAALQACSSRYVAAHRRRTAARQDRAPARRPFPAAWRFDPRAPVHGRLVFLRRTTAAGVASLLGRTFAVDPHWVHRLVRCEVDLDADGIRFYALRRREPTWQPLLHEVPYTLPASRRAGVTSE